MTTIATRRPSTLNYTTAPSSPVAALVGNTSMLLVPSNPARSGLVIVNVSDNNKVFLAFGTDAVMNGGLCLMPGVGWRMDTFTYIVDTVYAIADTPDSPVAVQEFSL